MTHLEVNPNRLNHLLDLYRMTQEELLSRLNEGRRSQINREDIFSNNVKLSHLKLIDKIFSKGFAYYTDPKNLAKERGESIFFRKQHFSTELSLGAKQVVNQFEQEKLEISVLAKLSDFKFERTLPKVAVTENPRDVARSLRSKLGKLTAGSNKDYLKAVIERLADFNVLVFEFIEAANKKEKANIDGFFLEPNVIVLKRNQKALKREIFTLFHELAHYLLADEEIDNVSTSKLNWNQISQTERWCSTFAFEFLISDLSERFSSLPFGTVGNDFNRNEVEYIARNSYLSTLAIFTRLRIEERLREEDYRRIHREILDSIGERERTEKEERQKQKLEAEAQGIKMPFGRAKPIISPLYRSTLRTALYNGLINEVRFCEKLQIKPERLAEVLS